MTFAVNLTSQTIVLLGGKLKLFPKGDVAGRDKFPLQDRWLTDEALQRFAKLGKIALVSDPQEAPTTKPTQVSDTTDDARAVLSVSSAPQETKLESPPETTTSSLAQQTVEEEPPPTEPSAEEDPEEATKRQGRKRRR